MDIEDVQISDSQLRELIAELNTYLVSLYPPESCFLDSVERLLAEDAYFAVARVGDELAGCGAVKFETAEYGELKRIFVRPAFRRQGIARAIMSHLEQQARQRGVTLLRLETGIYQSESILLYETLGYVRCGAFGCYDARRDVYSVFMEKRL